jgi:hypothetical protein
MYGAGILCIAESTGVAVAATGSVPLRGEHVLPLLLSVSLLSAIVRAAYYGQPRRIYPVRALLEKFRTSVLGNEEPFQARTLSDRVGSHLGHSRWSSPTFARADHFPSAVIDAS